jgi:DNA-binding Lrp family transcriptional regulator
MSLKLEEKDLKILKCIEEDGNYNLDEISRLTNISRSTIHYRLKKFRKMGLIKGTFAELDPQVLGLDITTVTFVNVSYDSSTAEEIGEKLASISGVFTVYYVLGDFDFIVIAKAKDKEDLKRILREIHAIDGVVKTGTHFVTSTIKEEKRLLVNYNDEDLKKLFCGNRLR